MKPAIILLAAALLLTGCRSIQAEEYLAVHEHDAPFAYRETSTEAPQTEPQPVEAVRTVSRASDIRDAIQELMLNGEERGKFLCSRYSGNLQEDMQAMYANLLRDFPKFNYAMDSFEWSIEQSPEGDCVNVELQLRFTPQELQAIPSMRFPEPAMEEICKACCSLSSSFILQVSGYRETDFAAELEDYMLRHPNEIAEAPGVSVVVFPDRGNVRVVDFHFYYRSDRETLRQHLEETQISLRLVEIQLARAEDSHALLETLYKHLVPGYGYESSPEATIYSQMVQKVGSSRTMASVAAYLCGKAGRDCRIVAGERNGEPWYWNELRAEGETLYFDLHAAAMERSLPELWTREEMKQYEWLREPEPQEETEAESRETEDADSTVESTPEAP